MLGSKRPRLAQSITVVPIKEESDQDVKTDKSRDENTTTGGEYGCINLMYGVFVIAVPIVFSSPVILLPVHNTLQYPEYWYELLIIYNLTFPMHYVLSFFVDNKFLLKIDSLTSIRHIVLLSLPAAITFTLIYCGLYLFWTFELGYNFPMPFANFIADFIIFVFILSLWYQFPDELRADPISRKQLKAYIAYLIFMFSLTYLYEAIFPVFMKDKWYQPTAAFVFPGMRELSSRLLKRWISRCTKREDGTVKVYVDITSNVTYLIYVTIIIGRYASDYTAWSLLTVDLLTNLYHCYRIIRVHRNMPIEEQQTEEANARIEVEVQRLASVEAMEILVPLTYTILYVLGYVGPNSDLMNNMNPTWNQKERDTHDISSVFSAFYLIFTFDCACAVIIGFSLWWFCKINFFTHFCRTLKEYWLPIAVFS